MKQWKTNEVERGHTSYSPKTVSKTKIKLDSKNSANGFLLFRNLSLSRLVRPLRYIFMSSEAIKSVQK